MSKLQYATEFLLVILGVLFALYFAYTNKSTDMALWFIFSSIWAVIIRLDKN